MFNYVLYFFYLLIYVVIMYCMFNQLGKYQVKDMNVYIESLINELVDLWNVVTMCDISTQKGNEFNAMIVWTIHDAPGLTHLCGILL